VHLVSSAKICAAKIAKTTTFEDGALR
jgi:hypothetical protein